MGLDSRIINGVNRVHNKTKNQYDTVVVFGGRSISEQDALYAQGRESLYVVNALRKLAKLQPISEIDNKKKVTNAKGGLSAHNFFEGVDLVGELIYDKDNIPEWTDMDYFRMMKEVCQQLGLVTLWSIGDYGHMETPDWRRHIR